MLRGAIAGIIGSLTFLAIHSGIVDIIKRSGQYQSSDSALGIVIFVVLPASLIIGGFKSGLIGPSLVGCRKYGIQLFLLSPGPYLAIGYLLQQCICERTYVYRLGRITDIIDFMITFSFISAIALIGT